MLATGVPFFFIRSRVTWLKWLPGIALLSAALLLGLKILFFPAPEMAVLGEIVYCMLLGIAALGSLLGAMIVQYLIRHKRS
jgi:hypothetical protein